MEGQKRLNPVLNFFVIRLLKIMYKQIWDKLSVCKLTVSV